MTVTVDIGEGTPALYTIDEEAERITAVDQNGVAIAGAYRPQGHDYWCFYVTRLVTNLTSLSVPPHREHFWGNSGRVIVRHWVELIAALYVQANRKVYTDYVDGVVMSENPRMTADIAQHAKGIEKR